MNNSQFHKIPFQVERKANKHLYLLTKIAQDRLILHSKLRSLLVKDVSGSFVLVEQMINHKIFEEWIICFRTSYIFKESIKKRLEG